MASGDQSSTKDDEPGAVMAVATVPGRKPTAVVTFWPASKSVSLTRKPSAVLTMSHCSVEPASPR